MTVRTSFPCLRYFPERRAFSVGLESPRPLSGAPAGVPHWPFGIYAKQGCSWNLDEAGVCYD